MADDPQQKVLHQFEASYYIDRNEKLADYSENLKLFHQSDFQLRGFR